MPGLWRLVPLLLTAIFARAVPAVEPPAIAAVDRLAPPPIDSLSVAAGDSAAVDASLLEAQRLLTLVRNRDERSGFIYSGDRMEAVNDTILIRGNAEVAHKKIQLAAAEIILERHNKVAEARAGVDSTGALIGLPELVRSKDTIRGSRIRYDLNDKVGTIYDAQIRKEKSFYTGKTIRTLSEDEFHVHRGSYTTCDQEHPHFDFYSPRIMVLADEMAIARPVYLRVAEKRVMWIPFYVFSLRKDRQSGLLTPNYGRRPIRFAVAETEWEIRNLGYYLAPSDYWDATLSGDIRQRSGWLARARVNYNRRYRWNGRVETRLESRQDGLRSSWEWWTSLRHNQEIGEGAKLRASGTFQSNKDFSRDNATSLQDRLNRTLRSNVSYSKRWRSGNSLSVNASQTKNLDTDRLDTVFPEVSLRSSRRSFWSTPEQRGRGAPRPWYAQIYYDGSARLRNRRRGSPTDTTTQTSADASLRLSSQQRPLPWLHLNTSLAESWRDTDLRSNNGSARVVRTDRFSTTAGLTQTLYGQFHPQIGRLTALRHVVKPNLSLRYQAAQTETGGLAGFGGASSPWDQTRQVTMRLDNTFWIKLLRDEEESKVRLAQLNFSTSYNFDRDVRPLADLATSLRIDAGRSLKSRLTLTSEFYDDDDLLQLTAPRLKRFEVSSSLRLARRAERAQEDGTRLDAEALDGFERGTRAERYGGGFESDRFGYENGLQRDLRRRDRGQRLLLSHYYSRSRSRTSTFKRSWLRASLGTGLRQVWHVQYSVNYNLRAPGKPMFDNARITSELLSLQREFHDWTATLNLEPSSFQRDRAFFFKAQLKDIPQIKFERGDRRL